MAVAHERFRTVMSQFATGVTVVTGLDDSDEPVWFTANAFTSVSMDPPLVLVCADLGSESLPALQATERFAVSVLRAEDSDLALRFSSGIRNERFQALELEPAPSGVPVLRDALAWLDCRVWRTMEAGDHVILVGEVKECAAGAGGRPLVFFRGGFGTTGPLA